MSPKVFSIKGPRPQKSDDYRRQRLLEGIREKIKEITETRGFQPVTFLVAPKPLTELE